MYDDSLLQPTNNSQQLKDANAQDSTSQIQSIRAHQRHITSTTHCAIDSMSNLACIPPRVAKELKMTIELTKDVLQFGSYSHDESISVYEVANDNISIYLPEFAVTSTGKMAILPSSWFSQMGYELRIHPYERGFAIINGKGRTIYEDTPHTDGFHYVTWDLLRSLQPTDRSMGRQNGGNHSDSETG